MSVEKISVDKAKEVAQKVNEIIQTSYVNKSAFDIKDVINIGLSYHQARRVMGGFVREKIVYLKDGKYFAHPDALKEKDE